VPGERDAKALKKRALVCNEMYVSWARRSNVTNAFILIDLMLTLASGLRRGTIEEEIQAFFAVVPIGLKTPFSSQSTATTAGMLPPPLS
jgi:hypothetical protein